MNFFKKILNQVKNVVSKVFHKETAPTKTMKEIIAAATNPETPETKATVEETFSDDELFEKAIQLAELDGEDFNGSDLNKIVKYERVQSWLEIKGYVDDAREELKGENKDAQ